MEQAECSGHIADATCKDSWGEVEFFATIRLQKAHWYRILYLNKVEQIAPLFLLPFQGLAFLMMKIDCVFVLHIRLKVTFLKKKIMRQSYIVYVDHDARNDLIARHHLYILTAYFTKNKSDSFTSKLVHCAGVNTIQEHLVTFGRKVYRLVVIHMSSIQNRKY